MNNTTMTKEEAIKIIDKIKDGNSFTKHMTTNEYIDFFRQNYARIFKVILKHDEVEIAKKINEYNFN